MTDLLRALVGAADRARRLADKLEAGIAGSRRRAKAVAAADTALFWGIGRADDFAHGLGLGADRGRRRHRYRATGKWADERIVTAAEVASPKTGDHHRFVVRKKFWSREGRCPSQFRRNTGRGNGALYEIKSPLIRQLGPTALTDGLKALQGILERAGQNTAAISVAEYG